MTALLNWNGWDWTQPIAAILGLVAALLFVTRYWIESGKAAWKNPFGRFLLQRKFILSLFFFLILVNRVTEGVVTSDAWPGQDAVTALVFLAIALHTFVPYRILLDAQKAHKPKEATQHGQSDIR